VQNNAQNNEGQTATRRVESYSSVYFPVTLQYLESSPIVVTGPASGRRYEFSGARPNQAVDARDVEALLRTRFFRRKY